MRVSVRGHELATDQPVADGGDDTAPTPTEMFVGALAACVGYYAERYLRRHEISTDGLTVTCDYTWAENPHRVGAIDVAVDAPALPADKWKTFARVVEHCTVHNTLLVPPEVRLKVGRAGTVAA